MRAIICSQWCNYNNLVLTKASRPSLADGQARIHIRFVRVSFATTLVVAGKYQRKPPLPFSSGTEIAGEVMEVADGVIRDRPRDIVLGAIDWSDYAEEVTVTAINLYVLPDGLEIKILQSCRASRIAIAKSVHSGIVSKTTPATTIMVVSTLVQSARTP